MSLVKKRALTPRRLAAILSDGSTHASSVQRGGETLSIGIHEPILKLKRQKEPAVDPANQNEGTSYDVVENKGEKQERRVYPTMSLKTRQLQLQRATGLLSSNGRMG